jgi:RNA polymerase-binding transcription factor DksA
MDAREREGFRRQLLELGRQLEQQVADAAGEALRPVGGEASGSLSDVPVHPADLGSDAYDEELALTLLETAEQRLREIKLALVRIERGGYGRCPRCDVLIQRERLRAIPYTRLCADCARLIQEKQAKRAGRDSAPSFGGPSHG